MCRFSASPDLFSLAELCSTFDRGHDHQTEESPEYFPDRREPGRLDTQRFRHPAVPAAWNSFPVQKVVTGGKTNSPVRAEKCWARRVDCDRNNEDAICRRCDGRRGMSATVRRMRQDRQAEVRGHAVPILWGIAATPLREADSLHMIFADAGVEHPPEILMPHNEQH